jgi:hypothetical protein
MMVLNLKEFLIFVLLMTRSFAERQGLCQKIVLFAHPITSVTRLSEFSPIGRVFTVGIF